MGDDPDVLTVEADRLAWRETGTEIVVLDLRDSVYYGLNPTGARLWTLLAGGATREDLVARLVLEQRVDDARAEVDVDEFLAVLQRERLVVVRPRA